MSITRDVVKDLLPLYLADEASPDTRALVEEWLRHDTDLARQARLAATVSLPPVATEPTAEKRALDRARRRLRWRSVLMGTAVYVTLLPLNVTFGSGGFRGLLIDNWPERWVVIVIAAGLWIGFWRISKRLRVSGL